MPALKFVVMNTFSIRAFVAMARFPLRHLWQSRVVRNRPKMHFAKSINNRERISGCESCSGANSPRSKTVFIRRPVVTTNLSHAAWYSYFLSLGNPNFTILVPPWTPDVLDSKTKIVSVWFVKHFKPSSTQNQ
eukprot:EG_transcript_14729